MTDLTEQWKKGELPDGFYYFKLPDGSTDIASEYKMIRYRLTKDADKVEVLAPVPTYQEYLESESHCAVYSDRNKWLKDENAQLKERNDSLNNRDINLCRIANGIRDENFALKELLKKCRYELEGEFGIGAANLVEEIDEVLK